MKTGPLTYKYIRQRNGRGRYGGVTIEIVAAANGPKVTDACTWHTFKQAYPGFIAHDLLKLWKQSALNAATAVADHVSLLKNSEIILWDVMGMYADTLPSHTGAAMVTGIFDYAGSPLGVHDLELLDAFTERQGDAAIPDFRLLPLLCHNRT